MFRGKRSEIPYDYRLVRPQCNRYLVGIGSCIYHRIGRIHQSHDPTPKSGWSVVPKLQVGFLTGNDDGQIFLMHGLGKVGKHTYLLGWHYPVAVRRPKPQFLHSNRE